jgi:hypothetical protein
MVLGQSRVNVSLACAAIVALALVPLAGQAASASVVVVERASQYVTTFVNRFSHVVAEEHYVQDSTSSVRLPSGAVLNGPAQHRELVADFLLVKTDDATGWTTFRDVFEVNGSAVRDRGDRLTKLFVESPGTAAARAQAIAQESARYNIGPRRTINNPLLPLAFLQDAYRSRFSFSLKGQERLDGVEVRVVEYKEIIRPTLIRGASNKDVTASGLYWIDEQTGRILKAELAASETGQTSKVVVAYRFDERFQVCVPVRMAEEYMMKNEATVRATAKYDRFRQFEVKTDEGFK